MATEATEGMEQMMSQVTDQIEKMSERIQALEELIKETNTPKHGLDDSKQSQK